MNNWPNGTLSSTGASGSDWLKKAASFPNAGVIGATRRGNEVWFAWMASAGTSTSGGFNFPNANVQVVKIDPSNNYNRIDQFAKHTSKTKKSARCAAPFPRPHDARV